MPRLAKLLRVPTPAAHGLVLELLAGPLQGMYGPSWPGRLLFGFFAAMAETEREYIREPTLEGLDAAAHKGNGGRPPVITDDMVHTVLRRRANGETVENTAELNLSYSRSTSVRRFARPGSRCATAGGRTPTAGSVRSSPLARRNAAAAAGRVEVGLCRKERSLLLNEGEVAAASSAPGRGVEDGRAFVAETLAACRRAPCGRA